MELLFFLLSYVMIYVFVGTSRQMTTRKRGYPSGQETENPKKSKLNQNVKVIQGINGTST